MAMFKVEPAWAGYPQTTSVIGQVVVAASGAQPANTVIQSSVLNTSNNAAGTNLGPQAALLPYSPKVTAVVAPTPAYKPTVATGCGSNILMLDFSGFPANIVSVQLQTKFGSTAGGAMNAQATFGVMLDFDQTNKFVYCGIYNANTSNLLNWQNGMTLMFDVKFCDSAYP